MILADIIEDKMKNTFALIALLCATLCQAQVISTIAGNGINGYTGDGGPAIFAEIYYPVHLSLDKKGDLFFADAGNSVVRKIDTKGIITTVAGNGIFGYSGDNGPATLAQLAYPYAVVVDDTGSVFIVDNTFGVIRKVDTFGTITTFAGSSSGYAGDGAQATAAKFLNPYDIARDDDNSFFIADHSNQRIRKISSSGIVTTIGGTGIFGYNGDNIQATNARLNGPSCIAVDRIGNVYFGDLGNERIRKIDTSGIIRTIAGTGIAGDGGDGSIATNAKIEISEGIAVDSIGNIYFSANDRIRKVDTSGLITTVAGSGITGYSGDGGNPLLAEFWAPRGVVVDKNGYFYIADMYNNRIRTTNPAKLSLPEVLHQDLLVYPVPCSEFVNVTVPGASNESILITIVNLMGEKIQRATGYTNEKIRLPLSLPNGVYILSVTTDGYKIVRQLIVEK